MPVSAQLRAEVIRDVLSPHEQQLLLRHTAKKSSYALAQIYRQYSGPNEVDAALNQIKIKVEAAIRGRTSSVAALAQEAREGDDNAGGVPIRTTPRPGSTNGAGPAGETSSAPPIRQKPAPRPSVVPKEGLHTEAASPPRTHPHVASAEARDARVTELLREEPRSAAGISALMNEPRGRIRKSLERLQARKVAEPTEEATYDYPRSVKGGPPATVWRLVGDARAVREPAPQQHPMSNATRTAAKERDTAVLVALMERARSRSALADDLGENTAAIRRSLDMLAEEGKVVRTEHGAHDWKGAVPGRGRPSIVWRAVDGPDYVPPEPVPPPPRAPAKAKTYPVVDTPSGGERLVVNLADPEGLRVAIPAVRALVRRKEKQLSALVDEIDILRLIIGEESVKE